MATVEITMEEGSSKYSPDKEYHYPDNTQPVARHLVQSFNLRGAFVTFA